MLCASRYYRLERGMPILRHMAMRPLLTALCLTTLLGCSGVSSSAQCEPGSPDPCNNQGQGQAATPQSSLAGSTTEQDVGDVDPAAAFLMKDLGIEAVEAERRLQLQEQTPALATDLRARFPETFAGLWIDQSAGGAVTIAVKGGDPAVVELARERGFNATGVSATWSSAELEGTAGRLSPGAAALGLGIGVDVRSNQVLIMRPLDVSVESVSALLAAEPPGLVRIEQGSDTTG